MSNLFYIPSIIILLLLINIFIRLPYVIDHNQLYFILEIPLTIIGIILFIKGFFELRKKWLIENLPTSTIRSVAMGLAELKGYAKEKKECIKSPITLTNCVYYRFKIEREERNSRGRSYWKTVNQGSSTYYFYLEDSTGRILVDPLEADVVLKLDYQYIETIIKNNNKIRYTEWYIKPGDKLYVLGTVKRFKDILEDYNQKVISRLRELKQNKKKLDEFDINKDGNISVEEWDRARKIVEQEILIEEMKRTQVPEDDIVICKGDIEKVFIISDFDERKVKIGLNIKSISFIILGMIILITMIISIFARIGLLPEYMKINWYSLFD